MSSVSQTFQGFVNCQTVTASPLTPLPENKFWTPGGNGDNRKEDKEIPNPFQEQAVPRSQSSAADPSLAEAIALLANTLKRPQASFVAPHKWNNTQDPEQFDGLDLSKLRSFLVHMASLQARTRSWCQMR